MPTEKPWVIQRRDRWRAEIARRLSHLSQPMVMDLAFRSAAPDRAGTAGNDTIAFLFYLWIATRAAS